MWFRGLGFAGLLILSGCADDAGYKQSNYAKQPDSVAGYYSPVGYTAPYVVGSPVYGRPYVTGPVMGGIYMRGDHRDTYGGPLFSPYNGIKCDRRRNVCWTRNGPDRAWSYRFFGRRHAYWQNKDWRDSDWGDGHGHQGSWNNGGGSAADGEPWVYQVPSEPDGSGAPEFVPNP